MKRRYSVVWRALFFAGLCAMAAQTVYAQKYPDRTIQLVVPYVAGSTGDITARMLVEEMEKILGTRIICLNKPGASATLGTDVVVRAKKDGYTLLYAGASALIYAPISNPESVHYDPFKDVEPLGFHYFFPQTITVRSDAPWKSFPELIDHAKKNPEKLRVSTIGVGSTPHFILEMIMSITGTQFTHIPFAGGETVMTALLGGHVEVTCDGLAKVKPHADAGKMKVLLITNKMPAFPEIPTITELGYKESLVTTWFGLYAPAGIPEEVRKVLVSATEKAVNLTKTKIDRMGSLTEYKPPAELKKMTEDEYKKALGIAKKMGLRK